MHVSRQYLLSYFQQFLDEMRLAPLALQGPEHTDVKWWVACSGGPDSMLLLWLLQQLELPDHIQLKVVHVNYQTSEYSDQAQKIIEEVCHQANIDCEIKKIPMQLTAGNFEKQARSKRYQWFFQLMGSRDLLFTGHNLTDSMEWSWMQMLKSSHPKNWLGIPVRNGRIRRPLMCFGRNQVRSLCKHFDIAYAIDPSNKNLRFERNRMRHVHLQGLKQDYPSLEKNYVARHNQLAIYWQKFAGETGGQKKYRVIHPHLGGVLILSSATSLKPLEEKIMQLIHSLSEKNRGSVRDQLARLEQAWKNKKEGPILFSGGVQIYLFDGALLCLDRLASLRYRMWDEDFARIIEQKSVDRVFWQVNRNYKSPRDFICEYDSSRRSKDFTARQKALPILPKTCAALNNQGITWQSSFRYLLIEQKRLNKHK